GIDLVSKTLGEIASQWPEGRPLRVLELGSGGGATRRFLDRLAQSGVALAYLATNPDAEQAGRVAFAVESVVGATAKHWSPDDDDDLDGRRFDLILSMDGSAQVRLDDEVLGRLAGMLAPGGLLLAVEPEPNALWDLVFGRSAEW